MYNLKRIKYGKFQRNFVYGNEEHVAGNDHLTEIHLIEIVIFQLIEIFNN